MTQNNDELIDDFYVVNSEAYTKALLKSGKLAIRPGDTIQTAEGECMVVRKAEIAAVVGRFANVLTAVKTGGDDDSS